MISVQFVCQNMTTKEIVKSSVFVYSEWTPLTEATVKANRVRLLNNLIGYRIFTVFGDGGEV